MSVEWIQPALPLGLVVDAAALHGSVDIVLADGTHHYWSTHCRHGRHDACKSTELAPGVPRAAAQCKTCAAPCLCRCHEVGAAA